MKEEKLARMSQNLHFLWSWCVCKMKAFIVLQHFKSDLQKLYWLSLVSLLPWAILGSRAWEITWIQAVFLGSDPSIQQVGALVHWLPSSIGWGWPQGCHLPGTWAMQTSMSSKLLWVYYSFITEEHRCKQKSCLRQDVNIGNLYPFAT